MLIIDFHTLQTINVLYLIHNILLYSGWSLNCKNVIRSDDTIRQWRTCSYRIMFLNQNLFTQRNKILLLLTCLRGDNNFAVSTLYLAHGNLAINFRNDSRIRGVTSLEQLCDTRKTTSNVTRTSNGTWYLHHRLTCLNFSTVFNYHVTTYWEVIGTKHLALLSDYITSRNQRLILRITDNLFGQTGSIVCLSVISFSSNHVIELQLTFVFGNDDSIEWVPFCNKRSLFNGITMLIIQRTSIRNVHRTKHNIGMRIDETNFCQTTNNLQAFNIFHSIVLYIRNSTQLVKLNFAIIFSNNRSIGSCITCHTTGVEGSKCQLCTWLTNSLCSNHTNCLAFLYHARRCQVSSVAFLTNAMFTFASQDRTNLYALNRRLVNESCLFFCDLFTSGNNKFARCWMYDIMNGYST